MRIGEVSESTGTSTKTLRFYESIGLLPEPERTESGYRDYPRAVIERVHFIRDAQAAGLTLAEITSVLELKDAGHRSCEHTIELIRRHLDDIDAKIESLVEMRKRLTQMERKARRLDPVDCTDPHRCQVIADPH